MAEGWIWRKYRRGADGTWSITETNHPGPHRPPSDLDLIAYFRRTLVPRQDAFGYELYGPPAPEQIDDWVAEGERRWMGDPNSDVGKAFAHWRWGDQPNRRGGQRSQALAREHLIQMLEAYLKRIDDVLAARGAIIGIMRRRRWAFMMARARKSNPAGLDKLTDSVAKKAGWNMSAQRDDDLDNLRQLGLT